jgi:hypothetical protein
LLKYKNKFETLYTPGNEEHFHHTVFYECEGDKVQEWLKNNTKPKAGPCIDMYGDKFPAVVESVKRFQPIRDLCRKITFAWAIGGNYVINEKFIPFKE